MVAHTQEDLAWLAGFFDGEGCVCLSLRKKSGYYHLRVILETSHYDTMKYVHSKYGGWFNAKKKILGRKQTWRWYNNGLAAVEFLEHIYPYLKTKRLQAETAFEYKKYIGQRGLKEEKDKFYLAMKSLNMKGDSYENIAH